MAVIQSGDAVIVTRPTIFGEVATHTIYSPYNASQIGAWLNARLRNKPNKLVQDAFPEMKTEDREFLMTGITPGRWTEIFPPDEEQSK
jgi:hypothetical protein